MTRYNFASDALVVGFILTTRFVLAWEVAPLNGAPALFHKGKPVSLVVYKPHTNAPEQDYRDVGAVGVHFYNIGATWLHYCNPYWRQDGSVDMAFHERLYDKCLTNDPAGVFLPRLYYAAPDWWRDAHPEERVMFAGIPDMTAYGSDVRLRRKGYVAESWRESFASETARSAVTPRYRQAIRRLIDKYGDRLMGIHVAGGPCGEHFAWDEWFSFPLGKCEPPYSDVSEPMRRAFIAYLREKYGNDVGRLREAWHDGEITFEAVKCPDKIARETYDVAGCWRDPGRSRYVPDYLEAHHRTTADMIDHYCRAVKDESKDALPTMVFYGYTQDEPWSCETDHRAISRLYRCDAVEMYAAPHTYKRRKPGEDGGQRQYLASAALHGRLFIDEDDDFRSDEPAVKTYDLEQKLHLMYREFGQTVTHGTGLWYMDITGGDFRHPALLNAMGRMHRWGEVALKHSRAHHSEVAIVSNVESEFYMGPRSSTANNVNLVSYIQQIGAFYSAGAPFDWYLAEDIDAVEKGGYKVVVFLDCQFMSATQLAAVERMKGKDRTLVFFHAPAYVSERDLSIARTEKTSGFQMEIHDGEVPLRAVDSASGKTHGSELRQRGLFLAKLTKDDKVIATGVGPLAGRAVIAERAHKGWRSVHIAVPAVTDTALHEIYREAGVHLYTRAGVVMSANRDWLMLHTREADDYKISLPQRKRKITEITSEKSVGNDLAEFSWKLDKFRTAVFLMED